jgi:predicted nucleotidyltransferase
MVRPAPRLEPNLESGTAALAAVEPRMKRMLLFGSRARGDAQPDSDVDLVVVGAAAAERLAGSGWHEVARALREGRELHVAGRARTAGAAQH